jgi:DNA-binding HxlR family transcriptional regulator
MRSYGQYCALARALDVVGDRWTLLIVRELLSQQPCRYTDLRSGLPGIASNLLVERLRELEEAGIVSREAAPPPVATTLFRLTPRGEELRPVLEAIGRWGRPLLQDAKPDATFRSHWLVVPLEFQLRDNAPEGPPVAIEVRTGEQPMLVEAGGGEVRVRPGSSPLPDATVTGDPAVVLGFLVGGLDLDTARRRGLELEGDASAVRRLQPHPV